MVYGRCTGEYWVCRAPKIATNQAVGSSNLSGRAIFDKIPNHLAVVGYSCFWGRLIDATLRAIAYCAEFFCQNPSPVSGDGY